MLLYTIANKLSISCASLAWPDWADFFRHHKEDGKKRSAWPRHRFQLVPHVQSRHLSTSCGSALSLGIMIITIDCIDSVIQSMQVNY